MPADVSAPLTVRALLLLAALLAATGVRAAEPDGAACGHAIAAAERRQGAPPRVLGAIATVESGRAIGGQRVPWPWAINAEGVGRFYASKAEAVAAVEAMRAAGLRSIDVGCMQINLAAHPQAFVSLDEAFDPEANTRYAASFLRVLTRQTGRLADAITAYHSHTPEFAADYARRLLAIWPGAAAIGLRADPVPAHDPPGPYTPGFSHQIAQDRDSIRHAAPATTAPRASRLVAASVHGANWPAAASPVPP